MRNTTIAALSKTLPSVVSSLVAGIPSFLHVGLYIGLLLLIIIIFVICLFVRFIVWLFNYVNAETQRKERESYEWCEREVELLRALLRDRDIVSQFGEEIVNEALRCWFIEGHEPLKTARLQKLVEVNEAKKMKISEVGDLIQKNRSTKRIPWSKREELAGHLGEEAKVYGALAELTSMNRSLKVGRHDDEQEQVNSHKACNPDINKTVKELEKHLSARDIGESVRKASLHLLLLRAFLGELEKFARESNTEKAWVEEAQKLVDKVKSGLVHLEEEDKSSHRSSIWSKSTKKSTRRELDGVDTGFSHLFEIKERYGLKFIRGVPRQASQNETSFDANLLEKLRDAIKNQTRKTLGEVNKLIDEAEGNSATKFKKEDLEEDKGLLKRSIKAYTIEVKPVTSPIVALEEDINAVLELLNLSNNEAFVVVSIVGMRGIGKTTLAKKVFEHIKAGFEHFWVEIPDHVAGDRLHELVAKKVLGPHESQEEQNLIVKVFDRLNQQKPYLVVLDNVANEGWEALKDAFPKGGGNRILLTTRDEGQVTKTYALRQRTKGEEGRSKVVELLTIANNEAFVVVFIVGKSGIGKTTLAKEVFEHIKAGFEHFWVDIPDHVASHRLQKLVAKKVLGPHESQEEQNLIGKVRDRLNQQKPYLVVLDNVANEGWEALKGAFPKRGGSRIILTTSDEGQVTETYFLRLRTKEESWRLFEARVPLFVEKPAKERVPLFNSDVEKLAKEAVGKCGGLPLEIMDFAYLIAGIGVSDGEYTPSPRGVTDGQLAEKLKDIDLSPSPLSENFGLKKKNRNPSSQSENFGLRKRNLNPSPWSEHFELTKDKWNGNGNKKEPNEIGKLLGLFLLFPEGYEIPARRLLGFWNAIEGGNEEKKPKCYLKELIEGNMIQAVDRNLYGEVKKYCLPQFLRRQRERQLMWQDSSSHKDLLFLGSEPGEEIFAELRRGIRGRKFQNLRVLDLEHVFKPQLHHSIGKLKELRYLGLRWTYLESIPSSIGDLTNLQTLDIKHTCIREVPGSIWGLKNLRHLYLNHNYRSKIGHRQSPNFLENLQTLWGVFIDEESFQKNKLKKLTNLTKLGVAFQLPPLKQNKLADCVVKFTNLESLKLSSIGETGKPQDLLWKKPANLNKLSSLYLCGRLTGQNIKDNFPENLRDLTLSASGLTADPMQTLGQLGNLKSLCFYSDSYDGREMVIHKGGFRQLLVLRLWKLKFLEELQVEEGAMERLRELDIRSCDKLQVKNIALKHLKSLEELKLPDMEENLKEEIRKTWSTWPEIARAPMITYDIR